MSQSTTGKDVIARRYGRVLFQLAEEQKKTQEVMKDSLTLSSLIEDHATSWTAIINPTLTQIHRDKIITALAKPLQLASLTEDFLRVLVQRDRLAFLDRILHHYIENYKVAHGQIDATLKSTIPISQDALTALSGALKVSTGLDVTLSQTVDPDILGGVILQIGSLMVDASVGTRLNKLRQTMKG